MDADLPAITFRADAVGGDVSDGRTCPRDALTSRRRVVLLIHGFNVDEEHGRETYRRFVDRLREMLAIPRDGPVTEAKLLCGEQPCTPEVIGGVGEVLEATLKPTAEQWAAVRPPPEPDKPDAGN